MPERVSYMSKLCHAEMRDRGIDLGKEKVQFVREQGAVTFYLANGFGDIGTVWNESDQFSKNFIGGVGVGIRVIVPYIQMIRLDLAYGQHAQGIVPHFGIREKAFYHRRRVR